MYSPGKSSGWEEWTRYAGSEGAGWERCKCQVVSICSIWFCVLVGVNTEQSTLCCFCQFFLTLSEPCGLSASHDHCASGPLYSYAFLVTNSPFVLFVLSNSRELETHLTLKLRGGLLEKRATCVLCYQLYNMWVGDSVMALPLKCEVILECIFCSVIWLVVFGAAFFVM